MIVNLLKVDSILTFVLRKIQYFFDQSKMEMWA